MLRRLSDHVLARLWPGFAERTRRPHGPRGRGPVTHVIILDGTMSSLAAGEETNAGLTYRLLSERGGADLSVYYEAGIQWQTWRHAWDVIVGKGINRQIKRAYGSPRATARGTGSSCSAIPAAPSRSARSRA